MLMLRRGRVYVFVRYASTSRTIDISSTLFLCPKTLKTTMMNTKTSNRTSANDLYDIYLEPEELHIYKNKFKLTEGINDIAYYENCYWVIDQICLHKKNFNLEIWELSRNQNEIFTLMGKSQLGIVFVEIKNLQSDFYFDNLIILKKDKLLCLPLEENLY